MTTKCRDSKKITKRILTLILSLIMAASVAFPSIIGGAATGGGGQFDLDVIFVIDGSASMDQADPMKLALTAANLFVDMCEGSDSRVGYVMYSHVIRAQRELSDLISFSRDIKNEISAMTYSGWTDIALGLETALDMFAHEAEMGTDHRTPAIILLSDGNTHLPEWGLGDGEAANARVQALRQEAHSELKQFIGEANPDIPIFTIGFNFDGSLDMDLMQGIAEITGANVFETQDAADLPGILRDIYSDLTGARSTPIHVGEVTGYPQSVTIPIPDNSIYRAIVTIMSSQPVSDVSLTRPDGAPGTYTTNEDTHGRYTLITLIQPTMGDWILTFTGTPGDTVSIDLLSIYDIALVLDLPRASVAQAEFSWRLEDESGADIDDEHLLDLLSPTLFVRHLATGAEYVENFRPGRPVMTMELEPGDYEAYLVLDDHGIVRTSNTQTFYVPAAAPLSLSSAVRMSGNAYEVSLMTIFNEEATIALDDVVIFERENLPLSVRTDTGLWEDYVDFRYSSAANLIDLRALRSGTAEVLVTVSDPFGHSVEFYILVNISSGLIPIIAAAALLLLAAAAIVFIMTRKKPKLNDPMGKLHIKMTLPANVHSETPPEALLTLPPLKGKKTLRELINMNVGISEPYRIAFETINWFADGTVFSAKTKSELEIKVPSNSGYVIRIDKLAGKPSAVFNKDGGAEIRIGYDGGGDYSEYIIVFGNADPRWGGGVDVPQYGAPDDFSMGGQPQGHAPGVSDDNFW